MPPRLTIKGQVTVPKRIRDHLRLKPGTAVEFRIRADGGVELTPAANPEAWRGLAGLWEGPAADEYIREVRGPPADDDLL